MAESSSIGAAFNSYTGDPALGGGSYGFVKLDTNPLQDYAKYVMLRNKAEWDQKQKDAEKAADELSDFASLDLSTTIPKHATILQNKYDELYNWAQANPDALNYRDPNNKNRTNPKYLEYKKKKADLMNDIKFAKMNSIIDIKRRQAIADEPNEEIKKQMEAKLHGEIEAKDIRTILDHDQKYDETLPDWGQNKGQSETILRKFPNQDFFKKYDVFNIEQADKEAAAYGIGVAGIDQETTGGERKVLRLKDNSLIKAAEIFNNVVGSAAAEVDQNLTEAQKAESLKQKVGGLGVMKTVEQFNNYMSKMRREIAAGNFTDQFGKRLDPAKYADINWQDGISADEVSKLAQFTGWKGDKMDLVEMQTNDQIEKDRLALMWANHNLDAAKFNEADNIAKVGAQSVLAAMQHAIATGTRRNLTDVVTTVTTKNGKKVSESSTSGKPGDTIIEIADANLLKTYATLEKDGKTAVTPNAFYYNPKKKTMSIVYYEKDDDGKTLMRNGAPVVKEQNLISVDNWMSNLTGDRFTGENKGHVNNLVSEMIRSGFGYDLEKFATEYGTAPDNNAVVTKESHSASGSTKNSDGTKKKTYQGIDANGNPIYR